MHVYRLPTNGESRGFRIFIRMQPSKKGKSEKSRFLSPTNGESRGFRLKKPIKKMLKKGEKAGGLIPYAGFFKRPDPGGGRLPKKKYRFFQKNVIFHEILAFFLIIYQKSQ